MERLGKHIPAGAKARDSRMSIARQRRGKHTSSTIKAVFSAWFMQGVIKECSAVWNSSRVRNASLPGYKLGNRGIELSRVFGIGSCAVAESCQERK
jgi:hypothetical protein